MDVNIQAIADTLHLGQIYRNYDKYKEMNPSLPPKRVISKAYEAGKQILEHPNK